MKRDAAGADRERRVLVLATTPKDALLAEGVLRRAGVAVTVCADLGCVCDEIERGAAAVLLPEESISGPSHARFVGLVTGQPQWSDLPLLVLARTGADSARVAEAMDLLGNVTVLERPMRVAALVSAVRSALRARGRQYQIREYIAERERNEAALREAGQRKDEFLAILAHELRNPLAPIRNSLAVLKLTSRGDPTAQRVGQMMERQVDHMVRLVDDLLEVSRITRGKIDLRKRSLDLSEVLANAIETSRPAIEAARHDLVVRTAEGEIRVDGDAMRLAQVFANLLNNAAKYTPAGGRIDVAVGREADQAVVRVRDNGLGIPQPMLVPIFDPFVQVDPSSRQGHGGLGIGLTLVRKIVELHGGGVEARSDGPGLGSEFVVRLPLASARPPVADRPEAAVPVPATAQRVLVVDDNHDAAESLMLVLRLLGANVAIADNGEEALSVAASFRPAVVLLDLGMPGMDGYEVARRMRGDPSLGGVRLVALTGWGQQEDRRRTQQAGFDLHLTKPADVATLQSLLASLQQPA